MADHVYKTLILGSGPAGYTAAIYAARANLQPIMLKGMQPGGQLTTTTEVENFPGFPEGIMGPEMMELFEKQAARFGTEIVPAEGSAVDLSQRPFRVESNLGREYFCQTLIITTGASANYLGLDNELAMIGRGVSACATCDGALFKGKPMAVVGGGDTAVEEALFLSRYATRVTLIHRRDELRASKIMAERARKNEKIAFAWNSEVDEVLGDEFVTGVRIRDVKSGATRELEVGALFIAIGHEPNTEIVRGQLDTDEVGYIRVRPGSTYTTIDGVFACGDATDPVYRQAVTAAGTGCMAAIDAERWLAAKGIH